MLTRALAHANWGSAALGVLLAAGVANAPSLPSPFGVLLVAGFGLGGLALLARRSDPSADSG